MKSFQNTFFLVFFMIMENAAFAQFPPAAGLPGTTAISNDSSIFVAWADACEVVRGGFDISQPSLGNTWFGEAAAATGKAEGNSVNVVSLGDGGSATLVFGTPIINGEGWDFAVFENALNDSFLELAFVEVSSDGTNFFRFPAVSFTGIDVQVATFGALEASKIDNFAGKYRQGYGTPFDLADLEGTFGLDLNHISHIKIIDVVGCIQSEFATFDSQGNKVNDPWPTPFETGGFDLDGVGVIHASEAGIDEEQNLIKIFPNPFENVFEISFDEVLNNDFELEVLNTSGLVIYKDIIRENTVIDLSDFPAGLYFVKYKTPKLGFVQKVLKMN